MVTTTSRNSETSNVANAYLGHPVSQPNFIAECDVIIGGYFIALSQGGVGNVRVRRGPGEMGFAEVLVWKSKCWW